MNDRISIVEITKDNKSSFLVKRVLNYVFENALYLYNSGKVSPKQMWETILLEFKNAKQFSNKEAAMQSAYKLDDEWKTESGIIFDKVIQ